MSTIVYYYPTADYAKSGSFEQLTLWSLVDDVANTADYFDAVGEHSFDLTVSPSIPAGKVINNCEIQIYATKKDGDYGHPELYARFNSTESGEQLSPYDLADDPYYGWASVSMSPLPTLSQVNAITRIGLRDPGDPECWLRYASVRLMVEYSDPPAITKKVSTTWLM